MKRFLFFFALFVLLLTACGPVTPVVESIPLTLTNTPEPADAPTQSASWGQITSENVGKLEQIGRLGVGKIYDVAASPDKTRLAVYLMGQINIYEASTLDLQMTIPAGSNPLPDWQRGKLMAFSPNGRIFAFSAWSGQWVKLWDLVSNKEVNFFSTRIPDWQITNLEFSPDETRLVVTTTGGSIRCDGLDKNFALFNLEGDLLFDRYFCGSYAEHAYRFTTDGKILFVFSSIMTGIRPTEAFLVDLQTGSLLESTYAAYLDYEVPVPNLELLYDISPDGKILAYVTYGSENVPFSTLVDFKTRTIIETLDGYIEFYLQDGTVNWQPQRARQFTETVLETCQIKNPSYGYPYQLIANTDEFALLSLSNLKTQQVELWDLSTCEVERIISFPSAETILFSPDGRWLAAQAGYEIYIWDLTRQTVQQTISVERFYYPPKIAGFDSRGTRLLFYATQWQDDKLSKISRTTISLFDIETGQVIQEIHTEGEFFSAEMTPTDELILTRDAKGINFWSVATGQLVSMLPIGIYVFDTSKDRIWLVPQAQNDQRHQRQIYLYNYRTGEVVQTLGEFACKWVDAMILNSDGKELLLSLFMGQTQPRQTIAFNIKSGTRLPESMLPAQYPKAELGDTFATDDKGGAIYLWKKGGEEPYLTLLGERKNRKINDSYDDYMDHDNVAVEFLSEKLILTKRGGVLRFWDTDTGHLLSEIIPDYGIVQIVVSSGHDLIAVIGSDGLIRLWGILLEP